MKSKYGKIWKFDSVLLEKYVKASVSFAEILRKMGYTSYSSNHYQTLKQKLIESNIDFSHLNGSKNIRNRRKLSKEESLIFIFIKNSDYHQRSIRDYIKLYNLLENKCKICGLKELWNDKPIVLQLDHINRDNKDNRLDNLRWLCPNCHSQTETFGFKMGKK